MPHIVSLPTKLVHDVGLVPSHVIIVQMLLESDCGQAERVPTGGPVIVTHVPMAPDVLQAWHCPLHEDEQQTSSTHVAPVGHMVELVHMAPMPTFMTVTVIVDVAIRLFASVAVITSIPAIAPAV
jgi:hypothetical protein